MITKDLFTSLLATFGLAILLQQGLNLIFGPEVQTAEPGYATLLLFDGLVTIAVIKLVAFALAAGLAITVVLFMKRSRMGQAIRATSQDARAARVLGVNTDKVYAFTFALNSAICGAAGVLIVMIWVIQPFYGITYSIRSFVIVVFAGLGNLPAVIFSALGLGAAEQFSASCSVRSSRSPLSSASCWRCWSGDKCSRPVCARWSSNGRKRKLLCVAIVLFGLVAPLAFPNFSNQIAMLWLMILFAVTWDIMGGQMGYNSLGNIFFFGAGMYISAIVQIAIVYDVAEYTSAFGAIKVEFTQAQYFSGIALGIVAAAIGSVVFAVVLGSAVFGLRGAYFAIGTLGLSLAAAELVGGWEYVGGGGGISMPVFPGSPGAQSLFFYYMLFALAVASFAFLRWLYTTRFGLAINAIRDNENKADAMGVHTKRYKTAAWSIAAFFLGMSGAVFGNMAGFIEPLEVAFPTVTFGIFMVAMALLGGKGTIWGPVLGATLFHIVKELTWTYLLGWQWVALGAIIVINVVYFQQGIVGWAMERWPHRFGIIVDEAPADTKTPEPIADAAPRNA